MNLLPDPAQVVYSLVAFFVLLAVLARFGYPPIVKMLEERQAKIRESIEKAEETRIEAERLLDEYKKQIGDARAEAHAITDQGKKVAETMKADIVAKAQEEASALIDKAKEEIDGQKRKALDELQERVADLTVSVAGRVVGKALTEADHKRLIEEYLAEIGSAQ